MKRLHTTSTIGDHDAPATGRAASCCQPAAETAAEATVAGVGGGCGCGGRQAVAAEPAQAQGEEACCDADCCADEPATADALDGVAVAGAA